MSRFRMPSRGRTNKQNPFTRTSRGGRPPDPRERSRRPRVARFVDAEGCEQRGAVRVASSPHSSSVRSIMENVSSHLLWSSRQHLNRKPSRPIKMRHRTRSVTETPFSARFFFRSSLFSRPPRDVLWTHSLAPPWRVTTAATPRRRRPRRATRRTSKTWAKRAVRPFANASPFPPDAIARESR